MAAIVEPKRTKRLTDEQKAKLIDAGKPISFSPRQTRGFLERQEPPTPKVTRKPPKSPLKNLNGESSKKSRKRLCPVLPIQKYA